MATQKGKQEGNGKQASASLSDEQLLDLYTEMVNHRRFEESAARSYGMGRIYGFCHLHIGQEAIASGASLAMADGDMMVSAYRIHTMAISRGVTHQEAMDELFGRATGNVGGMGGSMHLFKPDNGFYGGWGLVGQQVPTATGLAFSNKYKENGAVVVCFMGDGAVHQGAIHESLNLASIWSLPIVYIVENNHYGMGTAVDRISSLPPIHRLGAAYDIDHGEFDGMDVLKTYDAISEAFERARSTSRPTFLEAHCSRFRGHSMSDPGKYRTRDQLAEEKSRDPIPTLAQTLVERGLLDDEKISAIDKAAKERMKKVLKAAEEAPWPDASEIHTNVFAEGGTNG